MAAGDKVSSHEARWWEPLPGGNVRCLLCPRSCNIPSGKTGFCRIRKNIGGTLCSLAYGHPAAINIDPIEKKPLAGFLPGSKTFSIGTYGCNLGCVFCQNYILSRGTYTSPIKPEECSPASIVKMATENKCRSVAFTYNEPTVWAEYLIDIANLARSSGLATVLVSNAYVSPEPAREIFSCIDAANFDMKGFSEGFYSEMTGGSLAPVLESIKLFHSMGGHLELTNLVIPGKNDFPEMIDDYLSWVGEELGKEIPLHFSAYHPDYKYNASPGTPPQTLLDIRVEAQSRGFSNIYLGNIMF
ncbi:MAG: AmmeMemoRadiSam system radical SAM enzyme [Victivallales bacterium]|nr:AmmeMemoRadiSam system radical SAM enzyme [Victivallales bacterium]